MAYTKLIVIHSRLDRCLDYTQDEEKTSLETVLDYAMNRDKTEQDCFETALNCSRETAYADMMDTKRRWGKVSRKRKGYHVIQSFAPGEVTPEQAHAIGVELAQRLLADRYEVVVSTHLNKAHLHSHIVFNSVSFVDGAMYRDRIKDLLGGAGEGIRGTSDAICLEHGLSIIEPSEPSVSRAEWEAQQSGKPSFRSTVRVDIDTAIAGAYTMRSFWSELARMGYQVKRYPQVTHAAVKPPGGQRFLRLDKLGDGYSEAEILTRLTAGRIGAAPPISDHTPILPQRYVSRGRRYRVRGKLPQAGRPKGFRLLYLKYLYLLRTPSRRKAAIVVPREEVIRFDRYQEQFYYLWENRIDSVAQLTMQHDALQAEIDALTDHRADLYRLHRRAPEDTVCAEEISQITARLRVLRRELKLCVRIEGDIPTVQTQIKLQEERSRHEKADKSRPEPRAGTDRGSPTR